MGNHLVFGLDCLLIVHYNCIMERFAFIVILVVSSAIASPVDIPASKARSLDSIGGGHILRQLDSIGGGHILRDVIPRYPSYEKRGYDPLRGMTFGVQKKNFDEIDRHGFNNFVKKNFDEIDRHGFNNFVKKNFDEIDRHGFNNFVK